MRLKNKGITLISLVITINLTIGEEGIFNRAKEAKEQYTIENIREKLELIKSSVYIEDGSFTIDKYLECVETEKIEPFSVSSSNKVTDDTAIVVVDNKYIYIVKTDTKIEYEGKIGEVEVEENDTEIAISGSKEQSTLPIKLTLNITSSMKGKWVLNTEPDYIGTDEELYTEEIQSGTNVELVVNDGKEYYIHTISINKYGGKEETIKGPIRIQKKYHTHTGSSAYGGGCYSTTGQHIHGSGCEVKPNYGKRDPSTGLCNQCAKKIDGGTWTDCPSCKGGYYWTCANGPKNYFPLICGKSESSVVGYVVSY